MLRNKPSPMIVRCSQKSLEVLYAHRQAINMLIDSLEQYDRTRLKTIAFRKPKSRRRPVAANAGWR